MNQPAFFGRLSRRVQQRPPGKAYLPLPATSAVPLLGNEWCRDGKTVVLVAPDRTVAGYWYRDLEAVAGRHAYSFPSSFRHWARPDDTDLFALARRWQAVHALQQEEPMVLVTWPEAFLEKTVTPPYLKERQFRLAVGDRIDPDFLNEWLFDMDFERTDMVTQPGEFALRGAIVDIYPFDAGEPYRIEWDDDRVERIRPFDPENQLSRRRRAESLVITAPPAGDYPRTTLTALLPEGSVVYTYSHRELDQLAATVPPRYADRFAGPGEWEKSRVPLLWLTSAADESRDEIPAQVAPLPAFGGRFENFKTYLREKTAAGYRVWIAAGEARRRRRLASLLEDAPAVEWLPFDLWRGFENREEAVVVVPEHQIFERPYRLPADKRRQKKQKTLLRELQDWHPGDYIVHADHGIGIYEGLVQIERNGRREEAVKIRYKHDDLIYVSIHSLHKLSKYRNKDGKPPAVHRLGSTAWRRTKERTKKRLKKLAFDLLSLYAERKKQKGFAFGADTPMQWQLESSFIYEETPDQARAIAEVKKDMESDRPMDRLVCGDVGFGKTEVAVRAAFKAVDNGKQVAVLVPTTVLAFQHYETFRKRLAPFPVTVDYLNRFRSTKERRRILSELAEGKIDIIIGTHALVSDHVRFKDLGLLIIDEEQKFGVNIKEKIKHLKKNIDVLTLTATPIPRTLQFSLMGERDLSVINTPPPNRIPIRTHVERFDRGLIREAIRRETERGGQVFFVHNRVQDIDSVAQMLAEDFPHLRIAVAHGQMKGKELEKIMLDFMAGRYDILLSTAIIENGLDVPNANTIIVNNAHQFGLADLHQLRGRVGRSNRQAYCYFLIPSYETLTEEARKRMQVLENYTALGSGFDIAMHDLEIRGAGDLLGAEQSGFINDLGFDLYQKILREAVEEVRREHEGLGRDEGFKGLHPGEITIRTDREWLIPHDYINTVRERMYFYRRLNEVADEEALQQVLGEMADRFGSLPPQVEGLAGLLRIKLLAARLGFDTLIWQGDVFKARSTTDERYVDSGLWLRVMDYVYKHPDCCRLQPGKDQSFTLVIPQARTWPVVYTVLKEMAAAVTETKGEKGPEETLPEGGNAK